MLHLLLPAAALYGDRRVKSAARNGQEMVPPFPKHIKWHHMENPGLAGGILKDKPHAVLWVQTGASLLLFFSLVFRRREQSCVEKAGRHFMFFGALSNLYDRVAHGSVTDMLRFSHAPGKLKQLVFNIADFMLLFGAILTLLGRVFRKKA